MLSLFRKDPLKKLIKQYDQMLEKAMYAQRNGDIKSYSMLTAEAERIATEIRDLEQKQKSE